MNGPSILSVNHVRRLFFPEHFFDNSQAEINSPNIPVPIEFVLAMDI